jgi:hypothetical protein
VIARRALIVGLLGLACASACSRDVSSQHATARAPVRAKVQVAPVVDDHPWVIAFLTEISITRPPGADARLEGRTGLEGLRHPEPIIEAETREALERALAAYAGKFSKDARLEPVFEPDPFGPDARVRWRLHFVDRSRGFVLDEQAEAAIVEHDHGPSVHLYLSETQRAQLQTLSMDVAGGRLAVAIDDEALMVPIVMDPISNGEIQVLTRLREDQAQVSSQLFTRLTEQPAGG